MSIRAEVSDTSPLTGGTIKRTMSMFEIRPEKIDPVLNKMSSLPPTCCSSSDATVAATFLRAALFIEYWCSECKDGSNDSENKIQVKVQKCLLLRCLMTTTNLLTTKIVEKQCRLLV
jgi:hypothetical protein